MVGQGTNQEGTEFQNPSEKITEKSMGSTSDVADKSSEVRPEN